jgi:hypothetical protein
MKNKDIFDQKIEMYIDNRLRLYLEKNGGISKFFNKLIAIPYESSEKKSQNRFKFYQEDFAGANEQLIKFEKFLSSKSFLVGITELHFDKNFKPVWTFIINWNDRDQLDEFLADNACFSFTITVSEDFRKINYFKEVFKKKILETSSLWTYLSDEIKK